jgi:hypothetical protein
VDKDTILTLARFFALGVCVCCAMVVTVVNPVHTDWGLFAIGFIAIIIGVGDKVMEFIQSL